MIASEPVTVLIPTIGRSEVLRVCFASLVAADPPAAEVLVVDQSQTDVAATQAAEVGLEVRVVRQAPGLSAALNTGLREAAHDAVLVTNDDCSVAGDWVGVGARLLRERPEELHTGRVLPEEGAEHVPSSTTSMEPALYVGYPTMDGLYPNCMALSAGAALGLGGFDERLRISAEDNDFCYRWTLSGRAVRYSPEFTVWHLDWRTPAELRALYRRYWLGHGEMIGTHLRRRDRRILPIVMTHARWAAEGTLRRRLRLRRTDVPDPTYAAFTRMPVGLIRGWLWTGRSPHPQEPREPAG